MTIPSTIPGLRLATGLLAVYGLIWIGLEGDLLRVTLLGVGATAVAMVYVVQCRLGGRTLRLPVWLTVAGAAGLAVGLGAVPVTLFLMALKTGLHAHGPEFTADEIARVWGQLPLWGLVGLLVGLGVGLIVAAFHALHANSRHDGGAG